MFDDYRCSPPSFGGYLHRKRIRVQAVYRCSPPSFGGYLHRDPAWIVARQGVVRLHLAVISIYHNITFWNTRQKPFPLLKKALSWQILEQKKVIFSVRIRIPLRFFAGGFRGLVPFGLRSAARFFPDRTGWTPWRRDDRCAWVPESFCI